MPIPTIGIGASVACDGQILVLEDMLGLSPRVPKFVKRYGDLGPGIEKAVADYAAEVRSQSLPRASAYLSDEGEKALIWREIPVLTGTFENGSHAPLHGLNP